MLQSFLDTDVSDEEFDLLRDQDHLEKVWKLMELEVNNYVSGYLEGISRYNFLPTPQESFTALLKK